MSDCQDLKKAVDDFLNAVNNWAERRRIIREIVIPIVIALMPGWPLIDPDTATNAELQAWIDALLSGSHECAAVFAEQSGGN